MVDIFSPNSTDGSSSGDVLNVLAQSIDQSASRSKLAQYATLRASQLLKDKRQDDAVNAFKQVLVWDPQNETALTYIGNIRLSQGKIPEAIDAFKALTKSQPSNADAMVKLGNAYLQDKQYAESEKIFKKASALNPNSPLADYTLGLQYLNTDRIKEAETQFLKVKRIAPADGNVHYSLGAVYNKQGRYDEAVTSLKTALSLKPNFPNANYELGVAYSNLGKDDLAQQQLTILKGASSSLASDLNFTLSKPKISGINDKLSTFVAGLGAGTPVFVLDPLNLVAAGGTKSFTVNIQFDTQMDQKSVQNLSNWNISRATGGLGGYYNNSLNGSAGGNEANIAPTPLSVVYNSYTKQATITFNVSQNSTGDATIDPSHIVFKFSGKDAFGRSMDKSGDQIDSFAGVSY
jgi:tetratricopeptide (TPR) repeat protein